MKYYIDVEVKGVYVPLREKDTMKLRLFNFKCNAGHYINRLPPGAYKIGKITAWPKRCQN